MCNEEQTSESQSERTPRHRRRHRQSERAEQRKVKNRSTRRLSYWAGSVTVCIIVVFSVVLLLQPDVTPTALYYAIAEGRSADVKALLAANPQLVSQTPNGEKGVYADPPLATAVSSNNVTIVVLLLDAGADVNQNDSLAIRYALKQQRLDMLQLLLSKGNPNPHLAGHKMLMQMVETGRINSDISTHMMRLMYATGYHINDGDKQSYMAGVMNEASRRQENLDRKLMINNLESQLLQCELLGRGDSPGARDLRMQLRQLQGGD